MQDKFDYIKINKIRKERILISIYIGWPLPVPIFGPQVNNPRDNSSLDYNSHNSRDNQLCDYNLLSEMNRNISLPLQWMIQIEDPRGISLFLR